jgi:hypothetical protein
MSQTMFRAVILLFFMGFYGSITASAYKDLEEICAGNCEQEVASLSHFLNATICYETATICAIKAQITVPILAEDVDLRIEKIRRFFIQNNSPGAKYAKLFVQVADANKIDWKLLPTFAFIESGCGRVHRHNNIFGWNSGKARFKTVEDGIRYVGRALTLGPYKNKTPTQKIRVYNVHRRYHLYADKIMQMLNDVKLA